MPRCARCLSSSSPRGPFACASCNWRNTRRSLGGVAGTSGDSAAWRRFKRRVEGPDEDKLQRVRMLALLLGEDGHAVGERAGAALVSGDVRGYQAELLRLTDLLLYRIHEF
jgi:hypothetical protein